MNWEVKINLNDLDKLRNTKDYYDALIKWDGFYITNAWWVTTEKVYTRKELKYKAIKILQDIVEKQNKYIHQLEEDIEELKTNNKKWYQF